MSEEIKKSGEILKEEYLDDGVSIRAFVPDDLYGKMIRLKKE